MATTLDDDDMPTTRRFHRSTREAFGDERGQWLEPPEETERGERLAFVAFLAFALLVLVLASLLD